MFAPVYLDWNATTPLDPAVREAMLPWLDSRFGNASSRHEYGRQARAAIDEARGKVAAATGCHTTEVVFTSGGSEANNLFIKGCAGYLQPGVVAISAIEHPCVREPARQLRRHGWSVAEIGVGPEGLLDDEALRRVAGQSPRMASVMLANNETGVLQDLGALKTALGNDVWLHSDAVQALGKVGLDFRHLGIHAMTVSAHKIGGPIGAGALIVDKRLELAPLIAGGGQERNLRSGTENVAAIVGFGAACERAVARLAHEGARLAPMQARLERFLSERGCRVFSRGAPRLPNTSFFAVDGIDGETLVAKLDRAGFACASGSACSSANPSPSHTLLAMGVAGDVARSAVRVSLGRDTSDGDLDRFMATFDQLLHELKNLTAMSV